MKKILMETMLTLLCGPAVCTAAGENLIKDGSFENVKARDRNGMVFTDWQGNVYEGVCQFDVGQVVAAGDPPLPARARGQLNAVVDRT